MDQCFRARLLCEARHWNWRAMLQMFFFTLLDPRPMITCKMLIVIARQDTVNSWLRFEDPSYFGGHQPKGETHLQKTCVCFFGIVMKGERQVRVAISL